MVFALGFVLGSLRVILLIPRFGEAGAVLIELPVILGIAWIACRQLAGAFDVAPELIPRLVMGATAFFSLMGAELGLSVLAFGRTIADHLAYYCEMHAWVGFAGQVAFGLFPVMQLGKRPKPKRDTGSA